MEEPIGEDKPTSEFSKEESGFIVNTIFPGEKTVELRETEPNTVLVEIENDPVVVSQRLSKRRVTLMNLDLRCMNPSTVNPMSAPAETTKNVKFLVELRQEKDKDDDGDQQPIPLTHLKRRSSQRGKAKPSRWRQGTTSAIPAHLVPQTSIEISMS
jgi:hypothetical protein